MKANAFIVGLGLGLACVAPSAVHAQTTQTQTQYVTVDGEVVRYEPGRVIVIRGADQKEVSYALSPAIVVPAEVKIGRRVTLFTEAGPDGKTQLVSRVTTMSVTPEGQVKRTTEDTRTSPAGVTTKTTTTNISGKVMSYETGKAVTITKADGTKATYLLNEKSKVPSDLVVGKTITILPLTTTTPEETVVETITYTTTEPKN
jgi:hypothetical protein